MDHHPRKPRAQDLDEGPWDVVVVGAGLTGLVTASLLARAGQSVLVLEARYVGAVTTGRSTAKVSLLQDSMLSTLRRRHPDSVVSDYLTANREAQAWLRRWCQDHGVATQARTAVTYAVGDAGVSSTRAEHRAATDLGLGTEWLDRLDLPVSTRGGVALRDQFQVDPMEVLLGFVDDLHEHGGSLVEGVRVLDVRGRDPRRVATSSGTIAARTVVLATNMPILDRGGFFARATPQRSYSVAFRAPGHGLDAMYLSADGPGRSLRDAPVAGEDLLLVGGNGHVTGRERSPRRLVDDLVSWTRQHWPGAEPTHTWSAQDYATASGLPYVGPLVPGQEDLLVAGGYSKWGMTNGVAAAHALASRILGGHTEWAEALRSWATPRLSGVPGALLVNASVGLQMGRGWIRPLVAGGRDGTPAEGEGEVHYDHLGTPSATSRVGGTVRRVSAVCPHLGGILAWNDAERSWDCPLHGSRFDCEGRLLEGPATRDLPRRRS